MSEDKPQRRTPASSRSTAEQQALERFPGLEDRYLGDPVTRFVFPEQRTTLPLQAPVPSAADALEQPGVVDSLRRILDEVAALPPEGKSDV